MIIGIEGGLGSGKTILMTRFLVKDNLKGRKLFANYGLKEVNFEPLDITKILDMHKNEFNLLDCSIGIDEITVFADCRKSGSKLNRLVSYFILQSRKRNVDIYFTTQNLNMVDFRLINYMDFQIFCEKVFDRNGEIIDGFSRYNVFDLRDARNVNITKFVLNISKYYRFYDTNEVILPPF